MKKYRQYNGEKEYVFASFSETDEEEKAETAEETVS